MEKASPVTEKADRAIEKFEKRMAEAKAESKPEPEVVTETGIIPLSQIDAELKILEGDAAKVDSQMEELTKGQAMIQMRIRETEAMRERIRGAYAILRKIKATEKP